MKTNMATIHEAYSELTARGFACGCSVPAFEEVFPPGTCTSRYARRATGEFVCIPCAEEEEVRAFAAAGRYDAYLSGDGREVTTWTGRTLARVTSRDVRTAGFCGRQTYVRAIDAAGRVWHGRGPGEGMYVRLRRGRG